MDCLTLRDLRSTGYLLEIECVRCGSIEFRSPAAIQQHPAPSRPANPVQGLQDGRLPAAIGSEEPDEGAVRDEDIDVGDDPTPGNVHRQALDVEAHWVAP